MKIAFTRLPSLDLYVLNIPALALIPRLLMAILPRYLSCSDNSESQALLPDPNCFPVCVAYEEWGRKLYPGNAENRLVPHPGLVSLLISLNMPGFE
jgi:hypothetical protein